MIRRVIVLTFDDFRLTPDAGKLLDFFVGILIGN